ncbi:MAG: hypothetical protein M3P30_14500 [Chloroflexota bacterium]|nr:hypothetical protein [Chloroflexota bacterium]
MANYIDRATLHPKGWNEKVNLPYGLRASEIKAAIDDIYDFLYNINRFLVERGWDRLEETLSAATFSGVMSELVVEGVSKRSVTIIKNQYHNGRPDLVPRGMYSDEGCLRGADGIEVKASRWSNGWQGHNVEDGWIMICQYYIDRQTEPIENRSPSRIDRMMCAQLTEDDWSFSGRGANSRRTPTASIKRSGVAKLEANAIYLDPTYVPRPTPRKKTQVVITEIEPESPT